MIIFPKLPLAVQMSKYPQNTILVKITYSWMDRGQPPSTQHHTFAPVDLTAPKVAAGKNITHNNKHINLKNWIGLKYDESCAS